MKGKINLGRSPEKEFQTIQNIYEGSSTKDHMDLATFAWNYYDNHIKLLQERRAFWEPNNLAKFLKDYKQQEEPKKVVKKRVVKKKVVKKKLIVKVKKNTNYNKITN